jgi:hypothetical protein
MDGKKNPYKINRGCFNQSFNQSHMMRGMFYELIDNISIDQGGEQEQE